MHISLIRVRQHKQWPPNGRHTFVVAILSKNYLILYEDRRSSTNKTLNNLGLIPMVAKRGPHPHPPPPPNLKPEASALPLLYI